MNSKKLFIEAKRRYPVGTKFLPVCYSDIIPKPEVIQERSILLEGCYEDRINNILGFGYIYIDNKWAEIVTPKLNYFIL